MDPVTPWREVLRDCLKNNWSPATRDFVRGRGGETGASPQRAVTLEPTKASRKRPVARRVFAEKALWLRCSSVTDRWRVCSLVAPRHRAFSAKTGPHLFFRQSLRPGGRRSGFGSAGWFSFRRDASMARARSAPWVSESQGPARHSPFDGDSHARCGRGGDRDCNRSAVRLTEPSPVPASGSVRCASGRSPSQAQGAPVARPKCGNPMAVKVHAISHEEIQRRSALPGFGRCPGAL